MSGHHSHRLLQSDLRVPIESLVSSHLGRRWNAMMVADKTELASHVCAVLSDGHYAVFAKMSEDSFGYDQFTQEMRGLGLLAERAGVLTPAQVGIVSAGDMAVMVLEAVKAVGRKPQQWREIGLSLAKIHRIKGDRCGLDWHNYFGPLVQDNRPLLDWPVFYAERRLLPWLRLAVDSGHMPDSVTGKVERLINLLPGLCGPKMEHSLLHGDAQQNNFITTPLGPVAIDAAVYYGHPEMDLAHVDFFEPVPDDLFGGYEEMSPIDGGFAERRDLWRVGTWLGLVSLDKSYLNSLTRVVEKYT